MEEKYVYIRENDPPIEIENVPDEHDNAYDYLPSFWFGRRYYLEEFSRCHNNAWMPSDFPQRIHGMETEEYYDPLFIELIGDSYVNVFKCKSLDRISEWGMEHCEIIAYNEENPEEDIIINSPRTEEEEIPEIIETEVA